METTTVQHLAEHRIRRIGIWGSRLCSGILIICAASLLIMISIRLFGLPNLNESFPATFSEVFFGGALGKWGFGWQFLALLFAGYGIIGYCLWMMRGIFRRFAEGQVFSKANGRAIRWIGLLFILRLLDLSAKIVPEPGVSAIEIKVEFIYPLIGLFLIALGWSIEQAVILKEEQDLTI